MGAMISSCRFSLIESLIEEAVMEGATLLAGGKRIKHSLFPLGSYFPPTLLINVSSKSRIANEEVFAPIILFIKVESISEALKVANGTIYGLGGSVFGSNRGSLQACIGGMKCGMIAVNDFGIYFSLYSYKFFY